MQRQVSLLSASKVYADPIDFQLQLTRHFVSKKIQATMKFFFELLAPSKTLATTLQISKLDPLATTVASFASNSNPLTTATEVEDTGVQFSTYSRLFVT